MGRPAIEITPEICEKAESLAAQGLNQDQIARSLGMGERTFYEKKEAFPQFSQAIKDGQAKGVAIITNKLFERGKGYSHPEEKIFCSKDGEVTRVTVERHWPPDTTAQIFFLKNRAEWTDKQEFSGEITVNKIERVIVPKPEIKPDTPAE